MTVRTIAELRDLIQVTRTPSPGKVYAAHIRDIIDTLEFFTKKTILRKTSSYVAALEDDRATVYYNSATDVVHTVPANSPIGYEGVIVQEGAGAVSLSPAPSLSRESHVKTAGVGAHMYFCVYDNPGSAPLISLSGDTSP